MDFTYKSNKLLSILETILILNIFFLFISLGINQTKTFYIILFILFSIISITPIFLLLSKRKIKIDNSTLYLNSLFIKKKLNLNDVLYYSKNIIGVRSLFCNSNNNICLFTNGKKIFISVKEQDIFEKIISSNNISYNEISKKNINYFQFLLIFISYFLTIIISFFKNIFKINLPQNLYLFALSFFFTITIYFIILIINDYQRKI